MIIPDAYDMWEAHDAEQDRHLDDLPVCCECKEPIQSENAVCVDGQWYCSDCEDEAWTFVRSKYLEKVV